MANSSSLSDNLDQELSLEELAVANGGIVWWLVGAMLLIPLTANSPSEKKREGYACSMQGQIIRFYHHLSLEYLPPRQARGILLPAFSCD